GSAGQGGPGEGGVGVAEQQRFQRGKHLALEERLVAGEDVERLRFGLGSFFQEGECVRARWVVRWLGGFRFAASGASALLKSARSDGGQPSSQVVLPCSTNSARGARICNTCPPPSHSRASGAAKPALGATNVAVWCARTVGPSGLPVSQSRPDGMSTAKIVAPKSLFWLISAMTR